MNTDLCRIFVYIGQKTRVIAYVIYLFIYWIIKIILMQREKMLIDCKID